MKNFAFALLFLLVCGARAHAANVIFSGVVVNGSRLEQTTAKASVQFLRVNQQGASQDLATVKSDAQGRFKSAPIAVAPSDLIFSRIDWQGYPYITPAFDGAGRTGATIDPTKLRLHIYDTTESAPPGMIFVAHHIALKDDGDNLKCIERIVVENPSNKTYIGQGSEGITLGLSLPAGAKNVEIDPSIADAKLIKMGKKPTYAISKPITPTIAGGVLGNAIIVNYSLPWSKSVDLSRPLLYPEKFFFIVREVADKDKILVDAPLLGPEQIQPIPVNGQMQMRVVKMIGAPQSPQPVLNTFQQMEIHVSRPVSTMMWMFMGLTVALCVFLPALMILGRRKKSAIEYSMRDSTGHSRALKSAEPPAQASVYSVTHSPLGAEDGAATSALIEQLAALDDDWEAGMLEASDYQTQRAQLKKQVVEQLKRAAV